MRTFSVRALSIYLFLCLLFWATIPPHIYAADADPCVAATDMARYEVSGIVWFGAGCLFGCLGVGAAYVMIPNPPASQLVGKPADYIAMYSDCYSREARSQQLKWSAIGCVGCCLIGTYSLWAPAIAP